MDKICLHCEWWVNANEKGNYEHKEAVKENKGFCLIEDLFTYKNSNDTCLCFRAED